MNELFNIEESLSPEAEYIKASGFVTWQISDNDGGDGEWIASKDGNASSPFTQSDTKIGAVVKMNARMGRASFDEWRMNGNKL